MILEMNFRRFRGLMKEFSELNDRRKALNRQNSAKNQPKACQVLLLIMQRSIYRTYLHSKR